MKRPTLLRSVANRGQGSASFTVEVTYDSLCALSRQFVRRPGAEAVLCLELRLAEAMDERGREKARERLTRVYTQHVDVLRKRGELTAAQAATLIRLARALA